MRCTSYRLAAHRAMCRSAACYPKQCRVPGERHAREPAGREDRCAVGRHLGCHARLGGGPPRQSPGSQPCTMQRWTSFQMLHHAISSQILDHALCNVNRRAIAVSDSCVCDFARCLAAAEGHDGCLCTCPPTCWARLWHSCPRPSTDHVVILTLPPDRGITLARRPRIRMRQRSWRCRRR